MMCALVSTFRVVAVVIAGCMLTTPPAENRVYEQTSLTVKQQLAQEYTAAFEALKR